MADYIEFTVNVNENQATDSQSVIDNKVKNNSEKDNETKKLENQARENMAENNESESGGLNTKAIKGYIMTNVVKAGANTAIRLAESYAAQNLLYGGNSARMNRFNNTISGVKGVVGTATGILGGITAGASVGGFWGGVIGGIIGVVGEALNLTTEYNSKRAQIEWNLETERLSGQMAMNRLGLASATRGRISFNEFKM